MVDGCLQKARSRASAIVITKTIWRRFLSAPLAGRPENELHQYNHGLSKRTARYASRSADDHLDDRDSNTGHARAPRTRRVYNRESCERSGVDRAYGDGARRGRFAEDARGVTRL